MSIQHVNETEHNYTSTTSNFKVILNVAEIINQLRKWR